jgi:hypothetical protein
VGAKSAVAKASSKSTSVRATIPESIVSDLKLQVGDVLDWSVDEIKGKKYAKFRKLE